MKLASRFCRTCGSKILVRNVCHNCRSNPLEGNNYCYNCGQLTPLGTKCASCNTSFKRENTLKLSMPTLGILVLLALAAIAVYFSQRSGEEKNILKDKVVKEEKFTEEPPALEPKKDTLKIDTSTIIQPVVNNTISAFSSQEIRSYSVSCSYFKKNNRDSVLFFSKKGLGYIKINGNVVELRRTKKGNDISTFAAGNYQAKVIIEGLSGTSKEWLAAVSLILKDTAQKTSVKQKLYSTCIGF